LNTPSHGAVTTIGTSAMGALFPRKAVMVVLVTGAIGFPSTSSSREQNRLIDDVVLFDGNATSAGGSMAAASDASDTSQPQTTAQALSALRRASGLTWEQLGRLFGVSRRAVHFWASGKPMAGTHEEHLRHALALVLCRAGGPEQVRGALLSVVDGQQILELLASQRFADVDAALTSTLGQQGAQYQTTRTPLSLEAEVARRPLPPEVLATSEDEATHSVKGRGRSVRTSRSRGRGQS
jgi:DNA-binding transcriptional regulator YiaG